MDTRGGRRWVATITLAMAMAACGGSVTGVDDDGGAPVPGIPDPSQVDGISGQSGNEGTDTLTPCLQSYNIAVRALAQTAEAGCVNIVVTELLTPGARDSGFQVGDTLTGLEARHFKTPEPVPAGQEVLALYVPGAPPDAPAVVSVTPIVGDSVAVEYFGLRDVTVAELLAADCDQRFMMFQATAEPGQSARAPADGDSRDDDGPFTCGPSD